MLGVAGGREGEQLRGKEGKLGLGPLLLFILRQLPPQLPPWLRPQCALALEAAATSAVVILT